MVVITSPLAPLTLPVLVKFLLAQSIKISLQTMIRMLGMVILIPLISVELLRRLAPFLLESLMKRQFPISLVIFSIINLGVFSRYADFFYQKPATILVAALVGIALAVIYLGAGLLFLWRKPVEDRVASAISIGNMNNVLVIVFSSQFFGPLEPTVAAMYMIPFFGLILPLRSYYQWHKRKNQPT